MHIGRGTTNLGTYRVDEVRQGLLTGRFLATDLGWREGMEKWTPLGQIAEVAPLPGEEPNAEAPPPLSEGGLVAVDPLIVERTGLPWERRSELGTPHAWVDTLKMVLLEPARAFSAMRREGGLLDPLFYALIGSTVGAICAIFYKEVIGLTKGVNPAPHELSILIPLCIFMPLLIALGLFLQSAIIHLSLTLIGGATRPFETTFRTVCFSAGSASFLQVVPFCGALVAGVWNLIVMSIGLAKTHEISTGKAVLAVLLPTILCCGLLIFAMVAIFGGVAAAAAATQQ